MNTSNMKQQNIIIIGATSGIGKALFEKYAADGTLTFAYADKTTLRIQGYYVKDADGWVNYQRGTAEPSF